MTEFVPVNFQDQYFSVLNCYVQSVLLDYRFRVKDYQAIHDEYFASTNSNSLAATQKTALASETNQFQTVAHFMFGDERGELPAQLDLREVDLIYNDYVRVLTIMYEKLKNTYNTFVNRFLTEQERKDHNIMLELGRFALAGEETSQEKSTSTRTGAARNYKSVKEQSIINKGGQVVLRGGPEDVKQPAKDSSGAPRNMMHMK